jgi:hypothetical protein
VDDGVEVFFGEGAKDEVPIADVAFDETEAVPARERRGVGAFQRGIVEVVEVVEDDDPVTACEAAAGQMRADEPCSPRDEELQGFG